MKLPKKAHIYIYIYITRGVGSGFWARIIKHVMYFYSFRLWTNPLVCFCNICKPTHVVLRDEYHLYSPFDKSCLWENHVGKKIMDQNSRQIKLHCIHSFTLIKGYKSLDPFFYLSKKHLKTPKLIYLSKKPYSHSFLTTENPSIFETHFGKIKFTWKHTQIYQK